MLLKDFLAYIENQNIESLVEKKSVIDNEPLKYIQYTDPDTGEIYNIIDIDMPVIDYDSENGF